MTALAVETSACMTENLRICAHGRVRKIYGGTREIMKLLIARSL